MLHLYQKLLHEEAKVTLDVNTRITVEDAQDDVLDNHFMLYVPFGLLDKHLRRFVLKLDIKVREGLFWLSNQTLQDSFKLRALS